MKTNVIIKAAVASAFSFAAFSATASTVGYAVAPTAYATEGIPAAGTVTLTPNLVYTGNTLSAAAAATQNGLVTFTLPAGVTFVTTPSVAVAGTITAAAVAGGGAGQNFVTYNVTRGTATGTGTVTMAAFQITGATALASTTASGSFLITAQASGFATDMAEANDATAVTGDLATSTSANAVTVAGVLSPQINVAAPSNATRFFSATPTVADYGTLTFSTATTNNSTATAAFAFTSANSAVTVSGGNFNGMGAYLTPTGGACATTTPANSIAGTVSGNSITFAAVPVSATARHLCLTATGTGILRQTSLSAVTVSSTRDAAYTKTSTTTLGSVSYNGSVGQADYLVGSTSGGYTNYVRVVNQGATAAPLTVVVQNDNGTTTTGSLGSVAANTGKLFTVADINTATGSTLTSATDRASIVLMSPNGLVTYSNLMFNPNGTVVNIQ